MPKHPGWPNKWRRQSRLPGLPTLPWDRPNRKIMDSFAVIPEAIAAAENIFFSGVMADARFGISLPAVQACAEVITHCASITPDGFANLRFAALANVKAGIAVLPGGLPRPG